MTAALLPGRSQREEPQKRSPLSGKYMLSIHNLFKKGGKNMLLIMPFYHHHRHRRHGSAAEGAQDKKQQQQQQRKPTPQPTSRPTRRSKRRDALSVSVSTSLSQPSTSDLEISSPKTASYPHPYHQKQPPSPQPWTWTCHRCRRTWRVGTTQRCLHCGHRICIAPTSRKRARTEDKDYQNKEETKRRKKEAITSSTSSAPRGSILAERHAVIQGAKMPASPPPSPPLGRKVQPTITRPQTRPVRKKKSKTGRTCQAEFDFAGWEKWNEWRKSVNDGDDDDNDEHNDGNSDDNKHNDDYSDDDSDNIRDKTDGDEDDDNDHKNQRGIMTLLPGHGRLGVIGAKQEIETTHAPPRRHNCWNDCSYPSQCIHKNLESKEWT